MPLPLFCVRIIDDDPSVREVLSRMLSAAGFATNLYESAEQFMVDAQNSQPGCVLVDLMLPGLSGAELVDWMQSQIDPIPTIVLTGYGTVPAAVQCLKHGAFDFLEKPIDSMQLVEAVRRAAEVSINQQVCNEAAIEVHSRFKTLSDREKEVLMFMSKGRLSKQIASQLEISERTVEKHRSRIMAKMQADSLAALLRMVLDSNVLKNR